MAKLERKKLGNMPPKTIKGYRVEVAKRYDYISPQSKSAITRAENNFRKSPSVANKIKLENSFVSALSKQKGADEYIRVKQRQNLIRQYGQERRKGRQNWYRVTESMQDFQKNVNYGADVSKKFSIFYQHGLNYNWKNKLKFMSDEEIQGELDMLKEFNSEVKSQEDTARYVIRNIVRTHMESLARGRYSDEFHENWKEDMKELIMRTYDIDEIEAEGMLDEMMWELKSAILLA